MPFLKIFDLMDKINKPISKLSMGQKRAVGIVQAMVNNPKLLLLDEPTVYLDPIAIESFKELILELKKRGHSVIVSSHILLQIQDICDKVLIVKSGKKCAYGKVDELTKDKNLQDFFIDLMGKKNE